MRTTKLWNDDWLFRMDGKEEELVNVPHCYNTVDGQDGSPMYRGEGIYRKNLTLTEEDMKQIHYLEVGAAETMSQVRINGQTCYKGEAGFALYRVLMDPYVKVGDNSIEIIVSNAVNNKIYPAMADFSFYGGLYRDVKIISDDEVHFAETDGSRDGIILHTDLSENRDGLLSVEMNIEAEGDAAPELIAAVALRNAEGAIVLSKTSEVEIGTSEISMKIPQAHLWDGLADPYLYRVEVALLDEEGVLHDLRHFPIGFRTVTYDRENGFLLNGHPYKLNGVAKHQDFGGVGNAITEEHMQKDLELILDMGANAVRCSHYQHCDRWYELCDRAGLLVWAEVPVISCVPQKAAADENAKEQLRLLIAQVRNHTSVFCWGVQNETCMISKNSYTFRLVDELAKICKELDPSRMTAQANEYSTDNDCPIFKSTDILGFNYYYGWYYGTIPELQGRLDAVHAMNPEQPMILTEYGVDTNPQFHSLAPKANDYSEEYQLMFIENAINAINERKFMMGGFVWNMFDFGSAGRDEGGKKGQNQKGLVTIDRKLRKDAYFLYKAHWSKQPFVYIAGRRFVNRPQEATDITVLSNCTGLVLTVNGQSLACKESDQAMTVFEAVALNEGANQIKVTATDAEGHTCTDEIVICRVEEPDSSYVCPKKVESSNAVNWFEGLDPDTMERVEIKPLRKEGFTFDDMIPDIFDVPAAKEIFLKYLSPVADGPRFNSAAPMSVNALLGFMRGADIPKSILTACEQELNTIDKE